MTKAIPKLASILLGVLFVFCLFVFAPAMARADGGLLTLTSESRSGEGWTWNGSTLTLSNATFDDCVWLKVDSATIVLNGDNYMHGGVYGTKNSTSPDLKPGLVSASVNR